MLARMLKYLEGQLPALLGAFGVGTLVGSFVSGFLKKAGELSAAWASERLPWAAKKPVQVGSTFEPTRFPPASCAWVGDGEKLFDYLEQGWTHYAKKKRGGRVFRLSGHRYGEPVKEWLLVRPDAVALPSER